MNRSRSQSSDYASGHQAHVSHFGVLKAGPTIPVLKGNFPGSTLDSVIWTQTASNSATTTVADGMAELACGTNSAGSVALQSVKSGRFEAGQVTVFQSGVRAGTALPDNTRIWGLRDSSGQEGLYFKWEGETFYVVALKAGTETKVAQTSFNGETTWAPRDTNSTYRIEYSAGRAIFYRAAAGAKIKLHEMVNTAEPLVNDLDLGLYFENTNTGNTTDISMYVRGASSSVWGSLDRYNKGGAHIVADFDTEVALGNVSGYATNTKFGRVKNLDAADAACDAWAFADDGLSPRANTKTFPSSADTLYVTSSSASDTDVDVTLDYIDSTGADGSVEVNTNGQTPVSTGISGLDVNRLYVSGSTAAVGKLYASAGNDFTSGSPNDVTDVLAFAGVGYQQSQLSHFTVPLGKRLVMKNLQIEVSRANGSAGSADITLRIKEFGGVSRIRREFFPTTAVPVANGIHNLVVPARAQIVWRVDDVSDSDTNITVIWGYDLIDD